MTPSRTFTIDQLCQSRFNVRTNDEDNDATEALERSILGREGQQQRGLIHPIVVHPMRGSKTKFGVHAGGRRYRALKRLIERGELPKDYPIPGEITDLDDAALIELSLAENLLRRELRPYEQYAAVARAFGKGAHIPDIARHLGQPVKWVEQNIRLANLAPPIFAAFSIGKISGEQARAFAATEDVALQLTAFEAFSQLPDYNRAPNVIRGLLKIGDREEARLLRFVTEDAYRDAGGRYEADLFADDADNRGRVEDAGLLRQLVDAKLQGIREGLRVRAGRDVRVAAEYPRNPTYGGTFWDLEIKAEYAPLDDFDAEEVESARAKMAELEERARAFFNEEGEALPGAKDAIAEIDAVYEPLEQQVAAIEARRRLVLPDGDVFATLTIDDSGEPEVRWWWADAKAKRLGTAAAAKVATLRQGEGSAVADNGSTASPAPGAQREADAVAKDQHGLSQDGVSIFRSIRRANMRAMLVDDARRGRTTGHDYLLWTQLRILLAGSRSVGVGARGLMPPEADPGVARPHLEMQKSHQLFEDAVRELQREPFITDNNLAGAFVSFVNASWQTKNLAAAVVAGFALDRSLNADGYRIEVHDAVAMMSANGFDAALRKIWEPTTEQLDLIPKPKRLAIAEPFVEKQAFRTWKGLKSAELSTAAIRVLLGKTSSLRIGAAAKAREWIYPLLRFDKPDLGIAPPEVEPGEPDAQTDIEDHVALSEAAE